MAFLSFGKFYKTYSKLFLLEVQYQRTAHMSTAPAEA